MWPQNHRPDAMRFTNTAYHGTEVFGSTGRAQDEVLAAVALVCVDAHDDDQGVVLDGGQGEDLLGSGVDDGPHC